MKDHIAADQSGVDEREKFEKKLHRMGYSESQIARFPSGEYVKEVLNFYWDIWQAALSSNAAQSAGQEPVGYMVYWGVLSQKPYMPFNTKKEAEEAASCIKSATEIKPLYTHPSSAAQVEIRNAAENLMQWIETKHRHPVRDEIETGRMVSVRLHALADLYDALKTAAPSKGEE